MRNLNRMTNYWNKVEAWKDWERAATDAREIGIGGDAKELQPKDGASWRAIDKATRLLRARIVGWKSATEIVINPPED